MLLIYSRTRPLILLTQILFPEYNPVFSCYQFPHLAKIHLNYMHFRLLFTHVSWTRQLKAQCIFLRPQLRYYA